VICIIYQTFGQRGGGGGVQAALDKSNIHHLKVKFLSLILILLLHDLDCFKFTHFLGVIPVQEGCLTVAAIGHEAVLGLQSVTSPVTLIHAPVHTALVESTTDIATEGKNSIEVIHAVQCPLGVDM